MRPTCDQLLNNKILWALSVSDIQNDLMFEKFKNQSLSEPLMKNNFCNYFIKMKSMHKYNNEPKMLPITPVKPKMNEKPEQVSQLAKNLQKSLFVKK
jgi:hypothetical protein